MRQMTLEDLGTKNGANSKKQMTLDDLKSLGRKKNIFDNISDIGSNIGKFYNDHVYKPLYQGGRKIGTELNKDTSALDKIKNVALMTGGTLVNTGVEVGKGITDFAESALDTGLNVGSSKLNPFNQLMDSGTSTKDKLLNLGKLALSSQLKFYGGIPGQIGSHFVNKSVTESNSMKRKSQEAQELIKKDANQEWFDKNLGYGKTLSNGKTVQQAIDDKALIKSNNFGGGIARSIGNMLPSVMAGNVGVGNIGTSGIMGISSYGSGIEEAYQGGANREQANLYGLGNAGIETATEWVTGGVPGVKTLKNVGLDNLAEKGLKKVSNKVVREILDAGYKMIGEGTEEVLSELLNPYLKNVTYSKDEKINWDAVMTSFLSGAITGGILEAPFTINNVKNAITERKNQKNPIYQLNKKLSQEQKKAELTSSLLPTNLNLNISPINSIKEVSKLNIDQQNFPLNNNINDYIHDDQKLSQENLIHENIETLPDFKTQVNEVLKGVYPKKDMLVVSKKTPDVLRQLGLKDYPITLTQKHLETIMNKTGKYSNSNYHNLGLEVVEQLPEAIAHPLNVLKSSTKENSIVVVTNLSDQNGNIVIASIAIDGKGTINDIKFDSNVMTSAYGKSTYDNWMKNNKENILYDVDEGIKKPAVTRIQYPRSNSLVSDNNISTDLINSQTNIATNSNMQLEENNAIKYAPYGKNYLEMKLNELKQVDIKNLSSSEQRVLKNEIAKYESLLGYDKLPKNPTKESSYEDDERKITRKEIQEKYTKELGLENLDFDSAKNMNKLMMNRNTPVRLMEKIFPKTTSDQLNEKIFYKIKENEAEAIRFKNQEREDIKKLGIEPRSKESVAVQKWGEKKYVNEQGEVVEYGDHELMDEFPNSKDRQRIKKAAETIRNKYDKYIDTVNIVLKDMGYDPIPKRPDYFRHFEEMTGLFAEIGIPPKINDLPTDINGLTENFKPGKQFFSNALHRTGVKTTYDAITGIDGYLEGVSNLIYHTEDIQRLRTLEKYIRDQYGRENGLNAFRDITTGEYNTSSTELRKRLEKVNNNHLSEFASWLQEYTDVLAGKKSGMDRSIERLFGRKVYKYLQFGKKQVGSNMTGFNIGSALTNFISGTQGLAKTNKIAFLKGTADTIRNIFKNDGFIEKSNFLTTRFGSDQLSKKLWQKISNTGQILMTATDYFTANQIVRGKYHEYLANGYSESEAIKLADRFADKLMAGRGKGDMPNIFNSQMLGIFTQFQLEVNNQLDSIFYDTFHTDYAKERGKSLSQSSPSFYNTKSALFVLAQLFAFGYLFNDEYEKLTGRRAAFDPFDVLTKAFKGFNDKDRKPTDTLSDIVDDIIDQLPFTSTLTGGRIPLSSAIPDALKVVKGESTLKKEAIKPFLYLLPPTGGGQVKKTIEGLSMFSSDKEVKGSYTASGRLRFPVSESVGSKIQAALFGQYSSKNARDYFDNHYKTLTEKQTAELKKLKLSFNDYHDYRSGITNQKKMKEKVEYIASLPYSNKQKNIMLEGINSSKTKLTIEGYKKIGNYDEYRYSLTNPIKYETMKTFNLDYSSYIDYNDKIKDIKSVYKGTTVKQKVAEYINSLPLTMVQKIALYHLSGGYSVKDYSEQLSSYIEKQSISKRKKEDIWSYFMNGGDNYGVTN